MLKLTSLLDLNHEGYIFSHKYLADNLVTPQQIGEAASVVLWKVPCWLQEFVFRV